MSPAAAPCKLRVPAADAHRRLAVAAALVLLAAIVKAEAPPTDEASPQAESPPVVAAVWKERQLFFAYRSSYAIFPCTTLEDRVAEILRAVGARPDLEVKIDNCAELPATPAIGTGTRAGWEQNRTWNDRIGRNGTAWPSEADARFGPRDELQLASNVTVRLRMPVELTPDVAAELQRDRSRRELISRATGDPAARFNDPIVFAAQRRNVTLSRQTIDLEPVECELLDQMSGGFRKLGIKVVRRGFSCDRNRVSLIPPELEVEALLPASPEERREEPSSEDEAEDEVEDASEPAAPP